jgi:mono/diheme cytochrome c family protein
MKDERSLALSRDGRELDALSLSLLSKRVAPQEVRDFDPYYGREKRFRTYPMREVMALAFPGETNLGAREFILRAKDGYAVYLRGATLLEAYLAVEDLEVPGWEPIGPARVSPAPFYVVWRGQNNLETHPRPWQLARIEAVQFESAYPHTQPGDDLPLHDAGADVGPARLGASAGDAKAGYRLFREQCFRCHAINREGGRVGPELNVPRNILEYRSEADVRAYIRNPLAFRYGNMPPHPDLTERDLDDLIAYLRAMGRRKHDTK